MAGSHSILAPSDSARWLRCAGALYMSKGVPTLDAEYNASGTCSHWLGEWALSHPDLDLDAWLGKEMTFGDNPPFKFTVDEERLNRVRQYVTAIKREPGTHLYEARLDTTPVMGLPDQEGHADTVVLYPEGGVVKDGTLLKGVVTVHDFKDGYIVVNAKDNTQGLIYLCAAMMLYSLVDEFQAFRFCIHQPKMHHYDEWTYTRDELIYFMDLIRPTAKLAYDLYHGTVAFDDTQHLRAGPEQCTFCPVRGKCVERARYIGSLFQPVIQAHSVTDAVLGQLLTNGRTIKGALADYEAEALARATRGTQIEGWKLVKGNKGKRKWVDPAHAASVLELALAEKAFEPRVPISPTQAERLLKKGYEPLANLVTQSEAPWRLVPQGAAGEDGSEAFDKETT